ncbi:hypothetical protein [Leucobacter sp. NPDC077196]|uniref:hypothetical protein n=1 Tax=Leucobacter sp. NPDC077196 TaxID=3154959 RepID=UPI003415EC38
MQLKEVGQLLTIISSFDNRKLDESTAVSWKLMIDRHFPDASLVEAQEVVLDWFGTANPYFEVRHLIDGLKRARRRFSREIENDVRAAKARGLIGRDWPARKVLPVEVEQRLSGARARDREVAAQYAIEGPNVPGVELEVGRTV